MLSETLPKHSLFRKLDERVEIGTYSIHASTDKYSDRVLLFAPLRVFVGLCFAVYVSVQMEPIFECRTPPTSPELSRLVTKRRCPFGESPQPQKLPATENVMTRAAACSDGIYAVDHSSSGCAFQMLMNSQRNQVDVTQSPASPMTTITSSLCWVCHQQRESMPCAFCEHSVCEMCVRQCDRCFGVFCSFCSTINYDNHEDRPLCLSCHYEELRQQRNRAVQAGSMQPSVTWNGQRGLEEYRPLTA